MLVEGTVSEDAKTLRLDEPAHVEFQDDDDVEMDDGDGSEEA